MGAMKPFVTAVTLALVAAGLPRAQSSTRVVLLGTGTPNADPDRFGPSVAIVVGDASYLVDFGVGVVRRAAAAERPGVAGVRAYTRHAPRPPRRSGVRVPFTVGARSRAASGPLRPARIETDDASARGRL